MKPISLSKTKPDGNHYSATILHDSPNFRHVLFALKAGQRVGGHAVPPEVMMYVVKGSGVFTVGSEEYRVESGDYVVCKSSEAHGMKATEDMVVLAVIAPRPGEVG